MTYRPLLPAAGDVAAPALRRVRACVGTLFWIKAVGTTAFMWLFFVGYFHLLRHPTQAPIEMPLTTLDAWIPFQPWALWPYISLWLYVALPPSLLTDFRSLLAYGVWVGALCIAGLVCFYLWPTAVPRHALSTAGVAGFDLLRGVDAAGNACPSLHVATATFSAWWLHRLLRALALPAWLRGANALWYALIVWSTLATRQHVWWDVIAGVALALLFTPPSGRWIDVPRADDMMAPLGKRAGEGR
ncbi:MAG: phosphatase PAP2 family protein [Burkholderiaceae bacterium]|nr:phosphatase PAP2 family protein [Burkholderiaceae bacterium]